MGEPARALFFAVDDEPDAQRFYAKMLGAYGDVCVASSVATARQELAKRPDVSAALFDVCLPDGSGLDVLADFRRHYPSTPAVVLTGHVKGEVVNTAYDLDAGVMSKPLDRGRLRHWVERVMTHRAAALGTEESAALGARIESLKTLFARRPCDARVRYGIGEIVAELKKHPAIYGTSAVATAAAAVGEALPSLYRHARVAQRWSVAEFEGLLKQTMADGRRFSWSHFVSLAGVSAGALYDRIVEQALSQSWTTRQLDAALDDAGIAVPTSPGNESE